MRSFLNEPLRAEVELLDTRQLTVEDIRIRLAEGDDFDRLGVERSYFLTSIQFDVVVDETTGRGVIRLTTDDAVLEPFIDLIIEARWPSGRLLREYTVLVDPPAFRQDVVTVSASERVGELNPEKPARAASSDPESTASSGGTSSSSGDQLALRKSNLPSGQMPARAFSAETADFPQAGSRYMVKRDETLWEIARDGKPDGVSVQQAMLEIQRLNPEAFINGNINRVKAGYIIYLPAEDEMSSDDLARALDEVREQNQAWRDGRGAPGVTAAATLRVSADSSASQRPSADDARSGTPSSSTATQSMPTEDPALDRNSDRNTDAAEALPAGASVANAELAAQLDAMASRLDTLEEIVSLKDQQIATLEQALREAREAAAAATAAAAAAPSPAATGKSSAAPQEAATGLFGIPLLPALGGLLVIIGGVLFFVFRRRAAGGSDETELTRAAKAEDDVFAGVNLQDESFASSGADKTGEEQAAGDAPAVDDSGDASPEPTAAELLAAATGVSAGEDSLSRGGSRGYGERKHDDYIDEAAANDALAEADIYIAYGRYLQAIELLETAIRNDPDNVAYRVKLIELYVDMGEEAAAEEQLNQLRVNGSPDAIARAEALVGGVSAAAAPALDLDPGPVATQELSLDDNVLDLAGSGVESSPKDDHGKSADSLDIASELGNEGDLADLDDGAEEIEFEFLEIEEDSVAEVDGELDFGESDETLDLSDALVDVSNIGGEDSLSDSKADDESEELLIADDADQMATKLDLARAYIDMGDGEGARSILDEVIEKGTAEQQQESRDLLSRIG